MRQIRIGALAQEAGTNPPTIRYYESIGLLRSTPRGSGHQREYVAADIARVRFIRRCRELGFPIERVRALVTLLDHGDRSCAAARDLAHDQLLAVQAKLAELRALERSLASMVDACDVTCLGGPAPNCVMIADLGRATRGLRVGDAVR